MPVTDDRRGILLETDLLETTVHFCLKLSQSEILRLEFEIKYEIFS